MADPETGPLTFAAATQQAAVEQKLLLLEFFSFNSAESKVIRDVVTGDPAVKVLLAEKFVVVPVEVERQADLCKRYNVTRPGLLLVAGADGAELDRVGGRVSGKQLLEILEAGLAGRSAFDSALIARAQAPDAGVEARYKLAQAYLQRRQSTLAFQELAWCIERGPKVDPKGHQQYLSTILARVRVLSTELVEAKLLLERKREEARRGAKIFPTAMAYQTLFKFNVALQQSEQNTIAYLELPETSPLRAQLFESVFISLVEQRQYQVAATTLDLETFVARSYPLALQQKPQTKPDGNQPPLEPEETLLRKRVIELVVPAVEALIGAGYQQKAKRIAERAIDFDPRRYIHVRLIEAAQRAASPDTEAFIEWIKAHQKSPPGARPASSPNS